MRVCDCGDAVKRSFIRSIIVFVLVLSGIAIVHTHCNQDGHYVEYNETPLIHCPEIAQSSDTRLSRPNRGYGADLGKAQVGFLAIIKTAPDIRPSQRSNVLKNLTQQDLYRFQEVFRL